jgi:hypothetical protein
MVRVITSTQKARRILNHYIILNHIHPDLKAEYLMEEGSRALWLALQQWYEKQKAVILLEATHEWNHLRI